MSSELPVLDRSVLKSSLGDDTELIKEVLELFMDTTPELIDSLKKASTEGSLREVKNSAHSLKGSAGNIGAEALRASMKAIEEACLESDFVAVRNRVTEALEQYRILAEELRD